MAHSSQTYSGLITQNCSRHCSQAGFHFLQLLTHVCDSRFNCGMSLASAVETHPEFGGARQTNFTFVSINFVFEILNPAIQGNRLNDPKAIFFFKFRQRLR